VLSGAGCAVNAVNYYHNLTVMGGRCAPACPTDWAGCSMTRKQMELDASFEGGRPLSCMGARPASRTQAALAARG
jgi:hypothetical protein